MKRVTLSATVVALTLAGCAAAPPGTDGDLVDDWTPLAAATGFTPEAGTCHPTISAVGYRSAYAPTPCDQPHTSETLYVGTLTGADATGSRPPEADSTATRTAYATCEREANQALGADWRSGRIDLSVILPSRAGWEGGLPLVPLRRERVREPGRSEHGLPHRQPGWSTQGRLPASIRLLRADL